MALFSPIQLVFTDIPVVSLHSVCLKFSLYLMQLIPKQEHPLSWSILECVELSSPDISTVS